MPHGKIATGTNFEAIQQGITPYGKVCNHGEYRLFFIVPNEFKPNLDDEINFKNSKFVGFAVQCCRNLIDYPNCKII